MALRDELFEELASPWVLGALCEGAELIQDALAVELIVNHLGLGVNRGLGIPWL